MTIIAIALLALVIGYRLGVSYTTAAARQRRAIAAYRGLPS